MFGSIRLVFTLSIASLGLAKSPYKLNDHEEWRDLIDSNVNLTLDEFEDEFGLEHVTDPEEKDRREEALAKHEEEVKAVNERYENGNGTWWDRINEYSDLPDDEFEANHTGALQKHREYARGKLDIPMPYDEASERFFDKFRYNRDDDVPEAYDSKALGHVSPVKNQKNCGSCVAFATAAMLETVIKKSGVFEDNEAFVDISEQQMLDCGYMHRPVGKRGRLRDPINFGCNGAETFGYARWLADTATNVTSEANYPYKRQKNKYKCPETPLPPITIDAQGKFFD